MLSGVGLAGSGLYGQSLPPEAVGIQAFAKANAPLIIAIGVGAIALGAMLSFWSRQRMMSQMTAGLPAMGASGMPDMSAMMAGMGGMQKEVVKVRCGSCKSLEAEGASFCSKCGTAMA